MGICYCKGKRDFLYSKHFAIFFNIYFQKLRSVGYFSTTEKLLRKNPLFVF